MLFDLALSFPDPETVVVRLGAARSGALRFVNPVTAKDRADLLWYVEVYAAHSLGDPDDGEARRIEDLLPELGKRLFEAVFASPEARRLFRGFALSESGERRLTIEAEHPAILALPWELVHDPDPGGGFLFRAEPKIGIRRTVLGGGEGADSLPATAKERLHLLFVISRPRGETFLDPRADARAVLDALDEHAPGRVTWEILHPPTLDALVERLSDPSRPAVDVLHFDGHGTFREKNRTGYLLFESPARGRDAVPAGTLGASLRRRGVAFVVLSACQTAAMSPEAHDPFGSVAVQLLAAGVPSVLAMTHSVLAATTRELFGAFYGALARSARPGEALDRARLHLAAHPEKYQVPRGSERVWLALHDWFLPALYQSRRDAPLLAEARADAPAGTVRGAGRSNLPPVPRSGFYGRQREIWQIERWFTEGVRRVTITGFGGQGKTALALETGRWLLRTGMFEAVVLVDYAEVQPWDAEAVAVQRIGTIFGDTLFDRAAAASRLGGTATLLILDNLEALAPEPFEQLLEAAELWSRAGGSRVLCTTRKRAFAYRRLALRGLGDREHPDDALEWFAALWELPPAPTLSRPRREVLVDLFTQVKFHPLSIRVLAQQLKSREPRELGERLGELLATEGGALGEDAPAGLVASLRLSLDRLDDAARSLLPRLAVFHGGAMEPELLAISEISEEEWQPLRRQLVDAALVEIERVVEVEASYVRFHPTLAPLLSAELPPEERTRLENAFRRRYSAFADYLYLHDQSTPLASRAVVRRELPNLLYAARSAFAAGDPDALDLAESVVKLASSMGYKAEADLLLDSLQEGEGEKGSEAWFLACWNRGERLRTRGDVTSAARVFSRLLEDLGESPSAERAMTLAALGRSSREGGQPDLAVEQAFAALFALEQLEPSPGGQRLRGSCLADAADALLDQGKLAEALMVLEAELRIFEELQDFRSRGIVLGQLGMLAWRQSRFDDAAERYRAAIALFQQLGEREGEAVCRHQLGVVFQLTEQWEQAEEQFREAARIFTESGEPESAMGTWLQLAQVTHFLGKLEAAEAWCRKAITTARRLGNRRDLAFALQSLALFLAEQPERLEEARALAEETIELKRTLDPAVAKIATTYELLSEIAGMEADRAADPESRADLQAKARALFRQACRAGFESPGTRYELQRFGPLIRGAVAAAASEPEEREAFLAGLAGLEPDGWTSLVAAIRRIVRHEERDADALFDDLDIEDSMVALAILRGIEDPATLEDLSIPETQVAAGPGSDELERKEALG